MVCLMQAFFALNQRVVQRERTSERNHRMSSHHSDPSMPDHARVPQHREVPFQPPDPSQPSGQSILRRWHEGLFIWPLPVDANRTPPPPPFAFLRDEAQSPFLIYSASEADRDRL